MSLELEANVVHFPHDKPLMCEKADVYQEWTNDAKKQLYHSSSEIHLIKLGPLTEEFLTRKKVGWSKVDFGMDFKLTDEGYYKWESGMDARGIPIHHLYKLLDALKTIGYENDRGQYLNYQRASPVQKHLVTLIKKF